MKKYFIAVAALAFLAACNGKAAKDTPVLVEEESIISWRNNSKLTFINCACKFTEMCSLTNEGLSKRKEMKELIKKLKKTNPNIDRNIFKSLDNINLNCILGTKKNGVYKSFLEDYNK